MLPGESMCPLQVPPPLWLDQDPLRRPLKREMTNQSLRQASLRRQAASCALPVLPLQPRSNFLSPLSEAATQPLDNLLLPLLRSQEDTDELAEVVQLAHVLNSDESRRLQILIGAIAHSPLLEYYLLKGLAKAIRAADPGSINSGDPVSRVASLGAPGSSHSEPSTIAYSLQSPRFWIPWWMPMLETSTALQFPWPTDGTSPRVRDKQESLLTFQLAYATQALVMCLARRTFVKWDSEDCGWY
ncbi:unnamed protein product [Mortierella alpina]